MMSKYTKSRAKTKTKINDLRTKYENEIADLEKRNSEISDDPHVTEVFRNYLYYAHPEKDPDDLVPRMKYSAITRNTDRIIFLRQSIEDNNFVLETFCKT